MANLNKQSLSARDPPRSVRRRDERYPTRVIAFVHCHGRFQTVRIVDFSVGGLQLQGCFGVGTGDDIAVEFLSGQCLAVKVAWSMGSRLGVRFPQPLSAEHPALALLQHAAGRMLGRVAGGTVDANSENK
jgi:hypothetical protein